VDLRYRDLFGRGGGFSSPYLSSCLAIFCQVGGREKNGNQAQSNFGARVRFSLPVLRVGEVGIPSVCQPSRLDPNDQGQGVFRTGTLRAHGVNLSPDICQEIRLGFDACGLNLQVLPTYTGTIETRTSRKRLGPKRACSNASLLKRSGFFSVWKAVVQQYRLLWMPIPLRMESAANGGCPTTVAACGSVG